ncbi:MAG: O-antigen ligase family protein [Eubacteriales bacterium]|nr:O-antigen ligase family protein [Eubacteriales bacterium]
MRIMNLKKSLSKVRSDIHQMTRISELIEYVNPLVLEKIAFILLLIWLCLPIYILAYSWKIPLQDPQDQYFTKMMVMSTWYSVLQQIGFLGFLLGLFVFVQNLFKTRQMGLSLRHYIGSRKLPLFLMLLLIWSIFSTIFSTNPALSFTGTGYRKDGLTSYFAYCGLFVLGSLVHNRRYIKILLTAFAGVSATLMLPFTANWVSEITWMPAFQNPSIFMQFNHLGYYLCLATMAFYILYLSEVRSRWYPLLWLTGFALATASLVLNTAIGPIVAVIGGLMLGNLFYYFLYRQQHNQQIVKRIVIVAGTFILISVLVNLSIGFLGQDISQLSTDLSNIASGSERASSAGSGRWLLWQNGVRFAMEKPLWGYGPDNLGSRYAVSTAAFSDRPHNELIQFAASLGIPAMLFYLAGLAAHLQSFIVQRKKVDEFTIGLFALIGAYLISSLFGNTMFYTSPYFFLFLGISYAIMKTYDTQYPLVQ